MRPSAPFIVAVLGLSTLIAAVPAGAAGPRLGRTERAIVRAIDRHRADAGLRALRTSRPLSRAADAHSRDMLAADYFAHSSSNGTSFATRIHRYTRARAVGETLAMLSRCRGRRAAHTIVSMWMHSSMHRAILLTRGYRRVGVALRRGRLGSRRACVVTADFAR